MRGDGLPGVSVLFVSDYFVVSLYKVCTSYCHLRLKFVHVPFLRGGLDGLIVCGELSRLVGGFLLIQAAY